MTHVQVGLGCVRLGGGDGRTVADDVRLVHEAIDLGVTIFDTADAYGGGASEHVLGRALRDRRHEVQIATKAGFVFRPRTPFEQWARRRAKQVVAALPERTASGDGDSGDGDAGDSDPGGGEPAPSSNYAHQDFSASHVRNAVRASLRRLGTDRIDVFQLHGPETHLPGLVDQLADLVVAGDIVRIGVGADTVDAADQWVGETGVSVLHVPFGMLDPGARDHTMPAAVDAGQQVWVRGVLGGGLLGSVDDLGDHPKRDQVLRLTALADESGMTVHELALRYAAAHRDSFAAAIVGSTSPTHIAHSVEALTGAALDRDLVDAVDRITTPTREGDDAR